MNYSELVFHIILHGGNAKSSAMEAISHAKIGDFSEARRALQDAADELMKAHEIQTTLIQKEAGGEKTEVTLLMVHAQDHLMNAITIKDLANEFVDLYETIKTEGGTK